MKTQNRENLMVANFVSASKRHKHAKKPKITLTSFFNDLENRGPDNFKSDQMFRDWTKKIHADMIKEGTWVSDSSNPVIFVQEYVSRLQAEFWKKNRSVALNIKRMSRMYWPIDLQKCALFDDIYGKIRIFGLRKKLYYLQKSIRVTILLKSCVVAYEPGKYARDHWYPVIHLDEDAFFSTPFSMDEIFSKAASNVNLWYKFR